MSRIPFLVNDAHEDSFSLIRFRCSSNAITTYYSNTVIQLISQQQNTMEKKEPTTTTKQDYIVARAGLQRNLRNDPTGNLSKDWYNKNALLYDEQHGSLKFNYLKACLRVLGEFVKDKNVSIVDIAAGTGIAGMMLNDAGYRGRIDGVERSDAMLSIAKEKRCDVYEKIIYSDIGPNKIDEIEDGTYDHAICTAGVGRGQVEFSAIPTVTRMIKKGGYFIFSLSDIHMEYEEFTVETLKRKCERWDKKGICHLVSCTESMHTDTQGGYVFVIRKGSNHGS